jgi:glycosyltransferase involved in cell wall biosynthesis
MQIWLINPYGPITSENWRDYSFMMIADALTGAGHDVMWWTSNFSHHFKKFRCEGWKDLRVNNRFTIRLVPTTGYKRNIGIGRVVRDLVFGLRTYQRGKKMTSPDCIIYAESPLTFGYAGFQLARHHKCPVIYDQMDLWPEFIEKVFPVAMEPFVRVLFAPVYYNRKYIFRNLDAVMALARPYLDVMLREAPILYNRPHDVIYNGIDVPLFRQFMSETQVLDVTLPSKEEDATWAVFAGSLNPSYDIWTILDAAKMLEEQNSNVWIVIAGDGPFRVHVEAAAARYGRTRVYYVGKLEPSQLARLYKQCDIGLCAYSKRSNVEMPDKVYDYMAAGLPVVNSLRGEVSQLITQRKIGVQYAAENAHDLKEKLLLLSNNTQLRQEMASNSYLAGMEFDKNIQYRKCVDLVESLANNNQSS